MKVKKQNILSIVIISLFMVLSSVSLAENSKKAVQKIILLSNADTSHWQVKSFEGWTGYKKIELKNPARTVLQAKSQKSASGLVINKEIDLYKTPILHWSWKVDKLLTGNNERTKQGDDFPARVYVGIYEKFRFWKSRTINYVWSNSAKVNTHWSNPFTDKAQMIAVQSGKEGLGQWQSEKRNVRKDFLTVFSEEVRYINIIAIMSDSDNTKTSSGAYYGDIYFSAE